MPSSGMESASQRKSSLPSEPDIITMSPAVSKKSAPRLQEQIQSV